MHETIEKINQEITGEASTLDTKLSREYDTLKHK